MNDRLDLISRKAGEWAMQPDLASAHRQAARTLLLMARRYGDDPAPNPIADKSLKVLGCHLCRLTGNACCQAPAAQRAACPLGFAAADVP